MDTFIRFLGGALKTGNPAVFIETASHRNKLLERLHPGSPDIRTAIRRGGYVTLDHCSPPGGFQQDVEFVCLLWNRMVSKPTIRSSGTYPIVSNSSWIYIDLVVSAMACFAIVSVAVLSFGGK